MARTLKSSGLALNLVTCLGVDDDNTTIKDFKGLAVTPHANVTKGTASWKGTTYPYFQTYSGGSTSPEGVAYDTPPDVNNSDADGFSVFVVCAGKGASSGAGSYHTFVQIDLASPNNRGLSTKDGTGTLYLGGTANVGGTTIPSDGTKFSLGGNSRYNAVSSEVFYGLESGSLASDSTATNPLGGDATFQVRYVGGTPGYSCQPGKYALVCVFNRQLTLAEFQSLHNDPFGTLFDAASPPSWVSVPKSQLTLPRSAIAASSSHSFRRFG